MSKFAAGGLYAIAFALLTLALAITTSREDHTHVDHAYWCAATHYDASRGCP